MVNDTVIKAMGAFGGGIASTGQLCGALLGGVALISSIYSKGSPEEKDDFRMWRSGYKLSKIFENLTEPYGGINCKDIARVDWRDKQAVKDFYYNPESRRRICAKLLGDMAYALGEILDKDLEKTPYRSNFSWV